jgi:polysaccharide biosynthesis protein PslH
VFDISREDMAFWRKSGITNNSWLPPLAELALVERPTVTVPLDVLFVGGLRTPNNVQGVRWLVEDVLPLLLRTHPDIKVGIVGSYPDPGLAAELAAVPAVETHYNVSDTTQYQFGARVLVNPVAVGSGVQLKMLDMLMTDAPIVTRSQGLSGLPPSCADQLDVADTDRDFAEAILRQLAQPRVDLPARAQVREMFGLAALDDALARMTGAAGTR